MGDWIIRVVAVACLFAITELILPAGKMKKMASFVVSLALMITILAPVSEFVNKRIPPIEFSTFRTNVDTAEYEEKLEDDIRAILAGYQGFENASVSVTVNPAGKVEQIEVWVPGAKYDLKQYLGRDSAVKALLSALYRINDDKISIKRMEG
ncbi:MAG TPA: stage III sporulation protein AF [Clostridia bacterium]|nr:stage III sporulation protein AF [Clostridia bacterium]